MWSSLASNDLLEGDGDGTGQASVDGKEVAVVWDEVAGRRLHRVWPNLGRDQPVMVGIGDQGVPFRVDVELHRAHRTGAFEDLRQGDHRLAVSGGVDQVAATVDADARAPDADRVAERVAPLRAVDEVAGGTVFRRAGGRRPTSRRTKWRTLALRDSAPVAG